MHRLTIAAAAVLVAGTAAADEGRGRRLAEQYCAECHGIEAGRTASPRTGLASFATIAGTPGMTALALEVWLTTPHREMPHILLEAGDRQDLIAYITSLKGAAKP